MGTYWIAVNDTKLEYIDPHAADGGAKLRELPGSGRFSEALIYLLGGGLARPGLSYIGRWVGDRVQIIRDSGGEYEAVKDEDSAYKDVTVDVLREIDVTAPQ